MEGLKSFSIDALLSPTKNGNNTAEVAIREKSVSGSLPETMHRIPEMTSDVRYEDDSVSPTSSPASVGSMSRDDEEEEQEEGDPVLLDPGSHRKHRPPSSTVARSVLGPGRSHPSLVQRHPTMMVHQNGAGGGAELFYRYGGLHSQPPAPSPSQGPPSHPGAVALSMLASGSAFHSPGGGDGPPGATSRNGGGQGGLHHPPGPPEPALRMTAQVQVQAAAAAAAAAAHMQNIQLDWLARAGVFIPRMIDYGGERT